MDSRTFISWSKCETGLISRWRVVEATPASLTSTEGPIKRRSWNITSTQTSCNMNYFRAIPQNSPIQICIKFHPPKYGPNFSWPLHKPFPSCKKSPQPVCPTYFGTGSATRHRSDHLVENPGRRRIPCLEARKLWRFLPLFNGSLFKKTLKKLPPFSLYTNFQMTPFFWVVWNFTFFGGFLSFLTFSVDISKVLGRSGSDTFDRIRKFRASFFSEVSDTQNQPINQWFWSWYAQTSNLFVRVPNHPQKFRDLHEIWEFRIQKIISGQVQEIFSRFSPKKNCYQRWGFEKIPGGKTHTKFQIVSTTSRSYAERQSRVLKPALTTSQEKV